MFFADLELARRLEAMETFTAMQSAWTYERLRPEKGGAAEAVAGGCAVFVGVGSPLTHAVGIGVSEPVGEADLDRIEEFYRGRGSAVELVLCPLVSGAFLEVLGRRGYRLKEWENVLALPLDGYAPPAILPDVTVRPLAKEEGGLWAGMALQGFLEQDEAPPELVELFEVAVHIPVMTGFLACVDGDPAGTATVVIRDGVAALFGASTLPGFRNRGVQTALLRARLESAVRAGCDLAMVSARPGTTSQRNAERQGFRVAYTRSVMVREVA
jgi:GNAT superfamily N-acetyltransferase